MEDNLDEIANGLKEYHTLCHDCDKFIDNLVIANSLLNVNIINSVEKLKI